MNTWGLGERIYVYTRNKESGEETNIYGIWTLSQISPNQEGKHGLFNKYIRKVTLVVKKWNYIFMSLSILKYDPNGLEAWIYKK